MESDDDYSDPPRVIRELLLFDEELITWYHQLQQRAPYKTVHLGFRNDEVFSGDYHLYPGIYYAVLYNNWRTLRMVLYDFVVEQISVFYYDLYLRDFEPEPDIDAGTYRHTTIPEDFGYAEQLKVSYEIMDCLVADICASVPFYLSYHQTGSPWRTDSPHVLLAKCNLLTWPLFMIGQYRAGDVRLRRWAISRLRKIGSAKGTKQALVFADILETDKEILALFDEIDPRKSNTDESRLKLISNDSDIRGDDDDYYTSLGNT